MKQYAITTAGGDAEQIIALVHLINFCYFCCVSHGAYSYPKHFFRPHKILL